LLNAAVDACCDCALNFLVVDLERWSEGIGDVGKAMARELPEVICRTTSW
jgi:hypothetical protein